MNSSGTVSVVVCTHGDRQDAFSRLVALLGWQQHPFQLVVVVGGASLELAERVRRLGASCVVRHVPEGNIGLARNEGIRAAAGEIVVFIDDDALPVRLDWLERLTAPLRADRATGRLGAVGSAVYRGDTDYLEFGGGATSLSGYQKWSVDDPSECAPDGTRWIPRIPGGNCALARHALEAVGGFDEQYAYYLDETDLCVRLAASGFETSYTPDAPIRHFAQHSAAHGRPGQRDRFLVARSDAYFVMRHQPGSASRRAWTVVRSHPTKHFVDEGRALLERGDLSVAGLVRFRLRCVLGMMSGLWAGLVQGPRLPSAMPDLTAPTYAPHVARRVLMIDSRTAASTLPLEASAPWMEAADGAHPSAVVLLSLAPDVTATSRALRPAVTLHPADEATRWNAHDPAWVIAVTWLAALRGCSLTNAADEVIWLGDHDVAALLEEGVGRSLQVRALPGTIQASALTRWLLAVDREEPASRSSLEVMARLFVRRLEAWNRETGGADLESVPGAAAAALAVVRHCLKEGHLRWAQTLGRALRRCLNADHGEAIELDYHLANAARSIGDEAGAVALYESVRGRAQRPGATASLVGGACYHLAVAARAKGNIHSAVEMYRECLALIPNHQKAREAIEELGALARPASQAE